MLKHLKNLAKREPSGSLSGKQLSVGDIVVKVEKPVGSGGFATIYRCTDVATGAVYALKHFLLTGYPEAARDVNTEVSVMQSLRGCPHVVTLHEAALNGPPDDPISAILLMEFCPETLVGFLQQRGGKLDDHTLLAIFLPICGAVQAMHSMQPPLAHRDLKAENVLQGAGGQWLLCDFGSACRRHGVLESAHEIALEEEVVRKYTTPAYRAPELYDLYAREYIGTPVDIWALGVLLYLLCYGRLPFEGEAKLQVLNGQYTLPEWRPAPLRALIRDMLTVAPRERPTINQVLERLGEMAPPDLWQVLPAGQQQQQQRQHGWEQQQAPPPPPPAQAPYQARAAGVLPASSAVAASPMPEQANSQGWADFAAEAAPVAAAAGSNGMNGSSRPAAAAAAAAVLPGRQRSGSGSWATFSPKKEPGAEAAAPAAAAAGSFWSSFGEEVPLAASSVQEQQQEQSLLQQPQQPQPQPAQQQWQPAQPTPQLQKQRQPTPPAVSRRLSGRQQAAAAAAVAAGPPAASTPPPAPGGAPLVDPAEASPLSAGLIHMSRASYTPETIVPQPQAPAQAAGHALLSPQESAPAGARAGQVVMTTAATAAGAPPAGAVLPAATEAEELRQHCRVLEQLLEARNVKIRQLQRQAAQQADEIKQLRLQVQQQRQNGSAAALTAAAAPPLVAAPVLTPYAASATPSGSSTPGNSRLGQDVRLQVPGDGNGSSSSSTPTGTWVSFNASGGRDGDAPTPTLLQPASSFRGRSNGSSNGGGAGAAAATEAQGCPGLTPAAASSSSATPVEEALRARLSHLSLGSAGSGSSSGTPGAEAPRQQQQPLRSGSSGSMHAAPGASSTSSGSSSGGNAPGQQQQQQQHPALRSFPAQLALGSGGSGSSGGMSPLPEGSRSAPASAKPSPARTASIQLLAAGIVTASISGNRSPMQPSSPMRSRPGSSLGQAAAGAAAGAAAAAGGRTTSPSKHRRNVTAPHGGFFDDLNPLC